MIQDYDFFEKFVFLFFLQNVYRNEDYEFNSEDFQHSANLLYKEGLSKYFHQYNDVNLSKLFSLA